MRIRFPVVVLMTSLVAACAHQPPGHDAATERIVNADAGQWPSYGRDYGNRRFSPLKQINRDNVANLVPLWTFKSGINATFQATPIVVDGIMYLSLPFNHVVALDAATGRELWRYQHKRREGYPMCCGPANRGVAVGYGKVFIGTVDARLVALDAKTGRVLWDMDAAADGAGEAEKVGALSDADPLKQARVSGATGVGINMAPVVYQGKVIVGITGVGYGLHLDAPRENAPLGAVVGVAGRYGRPGFLAAFDVESGKRVWQFDTIPQKNWEGKFSATTPDGIPLHRNLLKERATAPNFADAWRFGGGSAWSTPAIDPKTGLLFFGTGNPSPQMDDVSRPGDNLYTVSLVALDANTGKLRWFYQQVPHDVWGYDVASPPVLFDLQRGGKTVPAVGQASKLGWFYVHNRETGELLLKSEAFVPQQNMFTHATEQGERIYPGVLGGVNWSPAAVDQAAQTAYVAAMHWPVKYTLHETPAGGDKPAIRYSALEPLDEPRWGLLSAIDLASGKLRWQHKTPDPLVGGVLATAGGLVFSGEGNGNLDALDAASGSVLWQYKSDAGVNAPPITYAVGDVQYIAVAAGGSQIFGFRQGDELRVFALEN